MTKDDEELIEDDKGRQTYFYVMFGQYKFPVYMPGTFMFNGVKDESPLAIIDIHKSRRCVNGIIHLEETAIFLTNFIIDLAMNYDSFKKQNFGKESYKKAVIKTLPGYAKRDAMYHCRLLALKDQIIHFLKLENLYLEDKQIAMFYVRDFFIARGYMKHSKIVDSKKKVATAQNVIIRQKMTEKEIADVIKTRRDASLI